MAFQPPRHRLGRMRERVNIYDPVETVDSAGQPVVTWSVRYAMEPAAFDPVRGGETSRGRQVEAGVTAIFTVHYRTTFTPGQSIVCRGVRYGVVFVDAVEGGTRYTELHCKAVV